MEKDQVLELLADEVRSLENKKQMIKQAGRSIFGILLDAKQEAKINKLTAQQMILRKMMRKIQKLTT